MKKILFVSIFLIIFFTSCGSPPATTTPIVTPEDLAPTSTFSPPEPTLTVEPIVFLDEFEGGLDPSWQWINEDSQRWSLAEEGWLSIRAANPGLMAQEGEIEQVNLLLHPSPEGSFMITTRLFSSPDEDFQQAGIFLIHDGRNYVSALNGFCAYCLPVTGGHGFYLESFINGEYVSSGMMIGHDENTTDIYLRLVYDADKDIVTGYAASQAEEWQELGRIENFPPIQQIGLGAANVPGEEGIQEDLLTQYAYFEVSRIETPVRSGDVLPQKPEPTPTPEPTELPVPTPLPEGVLFRDDFEGYLQPGWEWINENPEKWSFVEFSDSNWLRIVGDKPSGLADQRNTLMRPLPESDFVLTAHIIADPRTNFQQANIFIFENATNFIRLNFGYCDVCGLPEGGYGYFMETIIDNNPFGDVYKIQRDPEATDIYLRLVNQGGSITGYYATIYGEWQRIGAFGNYFDFVSVGFGATNSIPPEWEVEDLEALFDYFEISLPE